MKSKTILFGLLILSTIFTSCTKEVNEESSVYDVAIKDIQSFGTNGIEYVFTPFEKFDFSVEVRRSKYSTSKSVGIGNVNNQYIFSSHRSDDNNNSIEWKFGESLNGKTGVLWCTGMNCSFESGAEYFPIKIKDEDNIFYGWIKVSFNEIEIRICKEEGVKIALGDKG